MRVAVEKRNKKHQIGTLSGFSKQNKKMPLRPVEFREAPLAWMIRELSQLSGPALGYAFILAVCVIWVGGSFLVESLEAAGLSPLLLTYICNSLFVARRSVQLISPSPSPFIPHGC